MFVCVRNKTGLVVYIYKARPVIVPFATQIPILYTYYDLTQNTHPAPRGLTRDNISNEHVKYRPLRT